MNCKCRCHATSGSFVSCDVGPVQPGGNQSCTVDHDSTEPPATVPLGEACVLGHAEPVAREFGYACRRHYHWLDRTLTQIEELFALVDDVREPQLSNGLNGARSGTMDGSPAPARLAVMAITDRRNRPLGIDEDELPDVPGSLASWARMVVEERQTSDTVDGTVSVSIRILHRERLWISQQEWLDDYAGEVAALHRATARAVGDTMWPKPIGHCPNCGAPMYPTIGVDEAHCRRCKATWSGVALARLRLIHEQEGRR